MIWIDRACLDAPSEIHFSVFPALIFDPSALRGSGLAGFPSLGPLIVTRAIALIVRKNLQAWPSSVTGVLPEGGCRCVDIGQ